MLNIIKRFDATTEWDSRTGTGNWNRDFARTVLGVAMHKTGFSTDTAAGVIAWFHNRQSKVSAHYVVGTDGTIYLVIPEEYVAYATGGSPACLAKWTAPNGERFEGYGVNLHTIGIEVVGASGKPYTVSQQRAVPELVVDICRRRQLGPEAVFAHQDVQADKVDGREYLSQIREAVRVAQGGDLASDPLPPSDLLWLRDNPYDRNDDRPIVLGGGFKARWEALGELALPTLGWPVGNERTVQLGGYDRTVQVFERAVLGWFPPGSPDGVPANHPFHVRCMTLKEVKQIL